MVLGKIRDEKLGSKDNMKFYQMGYYRKGKQNLGDGWKNISPSEGMSDNAQKTLAGICSSLQVEYDNRNNESQIEKYNFGLGMFIYDKFLYYVHCNFKAIGEDPRGVTYFHGYSFNKRDYYELCSSPESFLGITENVFPLEYDDTITSFPVVSQLEHNEMDYSELISKYNLDESKYFHLLLGVINAIEYNEPLCIKTDSVEAERIQVTKEIMFLIMMGLPYHLRLCVSFFSKKSNLVNVYFSNTIDSSNYFDLERGDSSVEEVRFELFEFVKIFSFPDEERNKQFLMMANFINNNFENVYQKNNCYRIETSFLALSIKNREVEISLAKAQKLLNYLFKELFIASEAVIDYITELLIVVTNENDYIRNEQANEIIGDIYVQTDNEKFRAEVLKIWINRILNIDKELSYSWLDRISISKPNEFEQILKEIENIDYCLYNDYYFCHFVPSLISNTEEYYAFIKDKKDSLSGGYGPLLNLLEDLVNDEMVNEQEFTNLFKKKKLIKEILDLFPLDLEELTDKIWKNTLILFWNRFQIPAFKINKIKYYLENGVEEMARDSYCSERCENASKVLILCDVFSLDEYRDFRKNIYRILFQEEIFTAEEKKFISNLSAEYAKQFRDEGFKIKDDGFDVTLMTCYDFENEKFDSMLFIRKFSLKHFETLNNPSYINKNINNSIILSDYDLREKFIQSLENDKNSLKKRDKKVSADLVKELKLYLDILQGKDLFYEDEDTEKKDFINALHRVFIIELISLVLAVSLRCLLLNSNFRFLSGVILFVVPFLAIIGFGMNIFLFHEDGILEVKGITGFVRILIYILSFLVFSIIIAVSLIFNKLILAMVIASLFTIVAIAGIIIFSISEIFNED